MKSQLGSEGICTSLAVAFWRLEVWLRSLGGVFWRIPSPSRSLGLGIPGVAGLLVVRLKLGLSLVCNPE